MNKKTLFKKLAGTILIGTAVTLTACNSQTNQDTNQSSTTKKAKKSSNETKKALAQNKTKIETQQIKISQKKALNKFNEKYDGKKIKKIELKQKDGRYVYQIIGLDSENQYTVTVNAISGKILNIKKEKLELTKKLQTTLTLDETISRKEATKVAEKKVKGVARKWVLEQVDQKPIWKVTVTDGKKDHAVNINAVNKKVINVKNK